MLNIADALFELNRFVEAACLYEKELKRQKEAFGEEHPRTVATMYKLACLSSNRQEYARAKGLLSQVVKIKAGVLGEDHPETVATKERLRLVRAEEGRSQDSRNDQD